MMKHKLITVIILGSLVCTMILPIINASNLKMEDRIITCEIYGKNRIYNKEIFVHNQEFNEIQKIFETTENELKESKTREDTIEAFKKIITSLNKYNIFPHELGVNNIEKLIIGYNRPINFNKNLMKFDEETLWGEKENYFCNVFAEAKETEFFRSNRHLFLSFINLLKSKIVNFSTLIEFIKSMGSFKAYSNTITFGFWGLLGYQYSPIQTHGFVYTDGLYGIWNRTDSFFGSVDIYLLRGFFLDLLRMADLFTPIGITGFKGIRIDAHDGYIRYIGTALIVQIEYW